MTPLFYILSAPIFYNKYRIWKESKKRSISKLTQRELNKLYEGPPLDIAKGYSEVLLILALTMFYTPLLPILPVIAFFGLLFHYWIKKYMLLRINKIPESMGEDLAIGLTTGLPLLPSLYAIGQWFFIDTLSDGGNQFVLPILIITLVYYFVPKEVLVHK